MSAGSKAAALTLAALAALTGTSYAHDVSPEGHTTEVHSTEAGPPLDPAKPGFLTLQAGDPWPRVVRELPGVSAVPGRDIRRVSLAYFGQLADFQLADEESPARVEFLDPTANPLPFGSAWRPWEALNPHIDD